MSDRLHTRDRSVAVCGSAKTARINLGLELLMIAALPGRALTQEDIAAWCGCTKDAVYQLEREALKKLRARLIFGRACHFGRELARTQ